MQKIGYKQIETLQHRAYKLLPTTPRAAINLRSPKTVMTSFAHLPQVLQNRLRAELKPGETVTWVGQPIPNRYMRDGFKLWVFFIPWTAFTLFWIAAAAGFKLPRFDSGWSLFPLWGLPFLLIGLGGLSSPFWLRHKARSIVYALTNQRAISIEGTRSIEVRSFLTIDLAAVARTQHQDGSGNLILSLESVTDNKGSSRTTRHGFFAIENVRHVEGLVHQLVRQQRMHDSLDPRGDAGSFARTPLQDRVN